MAKNYKQKEVLSAVEKSEGIMEYVAAELSCSWDTARKYVDQWESTREAFLVATAELHALAYRSFHKAVAAGERWAVERVLDTSARRNGHGIVTRNRSEVEIHSVDAPTDEARRIARAKIMAEFGEDAKPLLEAGTPVKEAARIAAEAANAEVFEA